MGEGGGGGGGIAWLTKKCTDFSSTCRVGPLISSWSMRMEAKNSYFKAIACISNFKNIAYSVAKRHQLLLCAELQKADFFSCDMEYGAGKQLILIIY